MKVIFGNEKGTGLRPLFLSCFSRSHATAAWTAQESFCPPGAWSVETSCVPFAFPSCVPFAFLPLLFWPSVVLHLRLGVIGANSSSRLIAFPRRDQIIAVARQTRISAACTIPSGNCFLQVPQQNLTQAADRQLSAV